MAQAQVRDDARVSLQQAVQFSFDSQQPDGHWVAEVSADVTFTSQYVMFKYAINGLDLKSDGDAIRRWLLQDQNEDGSWGLAPKLPGNVSTTTEAYLALKILGVPADEPAMLRARDFNVRNGGVAKVRFFTRFFLATFGLVPWSAIPQMPTEFILMPPSSLINIYTLCSWARSTLIPILIVRHHEPVYALPNGIRSNNDFLDELWCDPGNKNIPYAPPLSNLFWERDFIKFGFTATDKILTQLAGLKHLGLRGYSRKKCVAWLLEHQEVSGDWAGFFPPIHGSVWALILEGFPLEHKSVRLGLEALERLAVTDARGKRLASTVSPVWDTALMVSALCDTEIRGDPRIQQAVNWLKDRQILGPQGDWRIYCPNQVGGGWSFEYHNTFYPDTDDTAVVVMALLKHDPHFVGSECISNAVTWLLGMQNSDGGYGAFDYDNNKLWWHKIPFSDMDSFCDPSTADVTGRLLECFGFLLSNRKGPLDRKLLQQVKEASERGIAYLLKKQEASGAWWGRWGNNYNYGTCNVMRGFVHFAHDNPDVRRSVKRAIRWFESVQNTDGGWGEDLRSYYMPELAGQGESTAAQTAWALLSLQPYCSQSYPAIENGIRWLISNQIVKSEHGASWPTNLYTGTGFPNVLYLGYPYYHHLFPIMALQRYTEEMNETNFKAVELPPQIAERLNLPNILLMVIGSRGDIQVFLSIAKLLTTSYGYRVRIATHPEHQKFVEREGIEFYSVGGSSEVLLDVLYEKPNVLLSVIKGEFNSLRPLFSHMIKGFWRSSIDSNTNVGSAEELSVRPFLADTIVSSLSTLAHYHCAEKLRVPLVLISLQPLLRTSEFPHVLTMSKPKFSSGLPWNHISYFIFELLNWLAFGTYVNYFRVKECAMSSLSWTWAINDFLKMNIPHVCLWSPHVLPRPSEWDPNVTIAGYTFDDRINYQPPRSLESFLETDRPVLAIGFGSMVIHNPVNMAIVVYAAVKNLGAKAVVCGSWLQVSKDRPVPDHIYLIDDIPHGWLLPRVRGFVHHGGAGHTAVGLRYGIPMLIIPFFLDQNFWAAKVQQLELGPVPIFYRHITTQKLTEALKDLLSHKYQRRCTEIASKISSDKNGAEVAAETIACVQTTKASNPPCSIIPALKAEWQHVFSGIRLSGAAAACLTSQDILNWSDLDLEPGLNWSDQLSASTGLFKTLSDLTNLISSIFQIFCTILRSFVRPWGKDDVKDDYAIKMQDPVRQARMKQGEYDLRFVKNGVIEMASSAGIENQIIENYRILSMVDFHAKFNNRFVKGLM